MIFNYMIGFLLTLLSIIIFQLFGVCLTDNKKSYSYAFIVGFIVYSFFVAIIGIPIQLLNLSWMYFFVGMIVLILAIIIYIVYSMIVGTLIITKSILADYIKCSWFLYLGSFIILLIALGHIDNIWANNLTDDGFYINKMATLPYIENAFRIDPVTGFTESGFTAYSLNTFELEASFYIYISGLSATLYARFFLALLNYFILLNAINAFIYQLVNREKDVIQQQHLQFFVVPAFLILIMNASLFIDSEASWTITSAAYFGSSLVRVGCPFICMIPLIGVRKLDKEKICFVILICVVMVSKSTIAIPTLFILAISYLIFISKKWWQYLSIILTIILIGWLLPNIASVDTFMQETFLLNIRNVSLILAIIICLILIWYNKVYFNFLLIIFMSILLILIPEVNDTFEGLSNFSFVADRTLYSIFIWLLVTSYISLFIFIYQFVNANKMIAIFGVLLTIVSFSYIVIEKIDKVYLMESISILYKNNNIVPNNTVKLGLELERYYEETGNKPILLMSPGLLVNDHVHFPAAILRSFSPNTISITGALRTQSECKNKESDFYGFNLDDLNIFSEFVLDPNYNTINALDTLNEKYPFNCMIGINFNDQHNELLENIGYYKYSETNDEESWYSYNIYVKE